MDPATKLILISRHELITDALEALFQPQPEFRTVGKAADTTVAISMLAKCNPDVAVVDLIADVWNGLSGIRKLRKHGSRVAIVALAMCPDEAYALEAIRCGASAYVLRSDSFETLSFAVREAAAGRIYISDKVVAQPQRKGQRGAPCAVFDRFGALTAREKEVLQLAMEGLTSAQIAGYLGISRRTADSHRASIYKKLLVDSHMDLVTLALRTGARPGDM